MTVKVPNSLSKTGLDLLVWSKVKASLMVEIRRTGWSGLADQTYQGLVRPGPPSKRICTALWCNQLPIFHFSTFLTRYYVQIKCFLNKLTVSINYKIESQENLCDDCASLRFGAAKIASRVSNFFQTAKWVILHDYAIFYKDWSGTSPVIDINLDWDVWSCLKDLTGRTIRNLVDKDSHHFPSSHWFLGVLFNSHYGMEAISQSLQWTLPQHWSSDVV